ncbi:GNAT family N-acetyltransferase [Phormidesmis priestleyi ULC007]|uniref:GNAT family N-acetyltransferase n=1 Tax=Phormidesmis priestleyi ULC007 TaxID=1920490 RepID=A0A2T1DKU8_9CYAN|nr:GNAT family N-acetyltransferase [Phormidesmis priestleyi]PSB21127.1 GNAT family N-acetyltransferase [Phormidesmis priestleyi ULC007]PZO51348.1 MAG: GNAT family N-acetyltransferase [Phormidesmis priestleyi]
MKIRQATQQDASEIMKLFYETIHTINIRDYSQEQVNAWAPDTMTVDKWVKRQDTKQTFVADHNGKIVGFAEFEPDGHIDCFYTHKDFQGQSVGTQLLDTIVTQATQLQLSRLFVEVSITARPFFEHRGFAIVKPQEVECRGVKLINFVMERYLS